MDNLDILKIINYMLDFKSKIRFCQVNKFINCIITSDIIYQELSRFRNCEIKAKFGSDKIIKLYYRYHMINLIREYKFDHSEAIQIAMENDYLDIIELIHTTQAPYFKYAKYDLYNNHFETKLSIDMINLIYRIMPNKIKKINPLNEFRYIKWAFDNIPDNVDLINAITLAVNEIDSDFMELLFKKIIGPKISKSYLPVNSIHLTENHRMDNPNWIKIMDIFFKIPITKIYHFGIDWKSVAVFNNIYFLNKYVRLYSSKEICINCLISGAMISGNIEVLEWIDNNIEFDYNHYYPDYDEFTQKTVLGLKWIKEKKCINMINLMNRRSKHYHCLKTFMGPTNFNPDIMPIYEWFIQNEYDISKLSPYLLINLLLIHGAKIIGWCYKYKLISDFNINFIIENLIQKECHDLSEILDRIYQTFPHLLFNNLLAQILEYHNIGALKWFYSNKKIPEIYNYDILSDVICGHFEFIRTIRSLGIMLKLSKLETCRRYDRIEIKNLFRWYEEEFKISDYNVESLETILDVFINFIMPSVDEDAIYLINKIRPIDDYLVAKSLFAARKYQKLEELLIKNDELFKFKVPVLIPFIKHITYFNKIDNLIIKFESRNKQQSKWIPQIF